MKSTISHFLPITTLVLFLVGFPLVSICQEVILQVTAGAEAITTPDYHFGFSESAEDGIDPEDLADPPPSPNDQINIAFGIPDCPPEFPNRWRRDLRSSSGYDSGSQRWELHLSSTFPAVELRFDTFEVSEGVEISGLRIIDEAMDTEIAVPGIYEVPIQSGEKVIWVVFPLDGAITSDKSSWGKLKASYRP